MNSEKIFEKIDMYFDGELGREEEAFLFTALSSDPEAREYFKRSSTLKNIIQNESKEFPENLEARIFGSISDRNEKNFFSHFNKNLFAVISTAAAILLIMISVYFYSLTARYESQLNNSLKQINTQNKLIDMLYNSMPPAEVKAAIDYKVIVTDKL